jgi:hypothetical protein
MSSFPLTDFTVFNREKSEMPIHYYRTVCQLNIDFVIRFACKTNLLRREMASATASIQ